MDIRTDNDELQNLKAGMAVLKSRLCQVDMMQKERLRASIVQSARELRPSLWLLGTMLGLLAAQTYTFVTEWQDMTSRHFWITLFVTAVFLRIFGKFCYVRWLLSRLIRQEATLGEMVNIIRRAEKFRYELTLPRVFWIIPILTTLAIFIIMDNLGITRVWMLALLVVILLLFIPIYCYMAREMMEKEKKLSQITADLSELLPE